MNSRRKMRLITESKIAGIVGVTAALALAERNISVVLLDKGRIAGEQSSRNLGWIRKTSRHAADQ